MSLEFFDRDITECSHIMIKLLSKLTRTFCTLLSTLVIGRIDEFVSHVCIDDENL